MQSRLEEVGTTFLNGYNSALKHGRAAGLESLLNLIPHERQGFAYEGAAMGLALLDCLTPWRGNRLEEFLHGAGEPHTYMVHVGAGWVWARVPWAQRRLTPVMDPLLHWLAFDGWGFHEGFFRWRQYIAGQPPPPRLAGYQTRAFIEGLGRSWWFVNGGNPELIAETLKHFAVEERADMWSVIGLAATYAGIASKDVLEKLSDLAGPHRRQLAQGSAFAAKARQRAGNLTDYTSCATMILCGLSANEAAQLCDTTLENLRQVGSEVAYETWRQRIQHELGRRWQEVCVYL